MTSQSVILNLNKDFAQSEAENYLQPVSQAFDVGKSAEVALYGANINRKPILVESTASGTAPDHTEIQLNLSTYPITQQVDEYLAGTLIDGTKIPVSFPNLEAFPETGAYTRDEFCNRVCSDFNCDITQNVEGKVLKNSTNANIQINSKDLIQQIPYSFCYDKEDFYFGLQGAPFKEINNETIDTYPTQSTGSVLNCQLVDYDNTESKHSTNILHTTATGSVVNAISEVRANAAVDVSNWSEFSLVNSSPLFPLFTQNSEKDEENLNFGCNTCFFEYSLNIDTTTDPTAHEFDCITGFTNTYLQSQWGASTTPKIKTVVPVMKQGNAIGQYPEVFVGVRHYNKVSADPEVSFLEVFCPSQLTERPNYLDDQENLSVVFNGEMIQLALIDMTNTRMDGLRVGYRFVRHDNQSNASFNAFLQKNVSEQQGRAWWDRCYSFQIYVNNIEGEEILYDSIHRNLFFPANIIEDGFLINGATSVRNGAERCNLGFQPYVFFNKASEGDSIVSPKGNWICVHDTTSDKFNYRQGVDFYDYTVVEDTVLQVLGQSKVKEQNITLDRKSALFSQTFKSDNMIKYDPNAYPRFRSKAGLAKLYTDNTQYNIEINLPIKAYNTTKSNINNLGQKRTIVYKTEPVIEGETHIIDSVYVNKNIQPNSLKFLTLNNSEPLNLNNMNVQIRRNHNNELATELEDASVELLIKSK